MLRQMNNEDLFQLYDSDLVLRLHNAKNLSDTRKTLARFKKYLGNYPPSPDLAKPFLAQYASRKPRTLYRYAQMLKMFMKWYGEPLDDLKVKIPKELPPYTEDTEIEKLISAIETKKTHKGSIVRDTLLVELALKTGMRRGELANLERGDIHNDFLIVRSGKNAKDRVIPLSPAIALRLNNFIRGKNPGEHVFGLKPPSITMKIKAFAKRAGLETLHAHTLRHKFATDLLEHGADIRSVQHLLGHENLSTTQVYLSITDKRLREAVNLLDDTKGKQTTTLSEKSGKSERKQYPNDLQPVVTIKDIVKPFNPVSNVLGRENFSHFIVRNEGNGPAIEIEMALLDSRREWLDTYRETILRANESLEFGPILHGRPKDMYYILCQYKQVSSQDEEEIWAQTWLPFKLSKASKEGEVYVSPGELEFKFGIPKKDKVEIFFNKPK